MRSRVSQVSYNSRRADLGDGCQSEEGAPWVRPRIGLVDRTGGAASRTATASPLQSTAVGAGPLYRYSTVNILQSLTNTLFIQCVCGYCHLMCPSSTAQVARIRTVKCLTCCLLFTKSSFRVIWSNGHKSEMLS